MDHPLLKALVARHGVATVDEASIDTFFASCDARHALLFFSGAGAPRPETSDVAVLFPELLKMFAGHVRGALVAPEAEAALKTRFQVFVFPSLVVTRDGQPVGVLPKILDWADYQQKIAAALAPDAPVLVAAQGPKTEFAFVRQGE
ncbi:hydrogenase accessory protein [Rhodoblastus sphagnicola]|uniref:Hydrogenase expression/formation protein n=1 Tax=Rhodoblastus sphagnicola TaxID=333368 RepID=A0A2S6N580_9HYPH|nr:hydrogenase accessory protein [Rhodoblastus sphagnicola]MBB4197168.1 hydrogenase-1 operon protein HyaE [Rhodoblastus sphagnicola]PPQ29783.1 hydrogenase accessory protein [Rhodoblastus sphagnicola]